MSANARKKQKQSQQAQEPKQEQARTYICPVCMKNPKTKGPMCAPCYRVHQDEVVQRLGKHEPVRSHLEFALAKTGDNITTLAEEKNELREETEVFFAQAHGQITKELRGTRLPSDKFLEAVLKRYQEIMVGAGKEELYERSERLKEMLHSLESQMRWMERIQRQSGESEEEIEAEATKDVSETAAVA